MAIKKADTKKCINLLDIYESLCVGCEREKYCHENCEYCEEYEKKLLEN